MLLPRVREADAPSTKGTHRSKPLPARYRPPTPQETRQPRQAESTAIGPRLGPPARKHSPTEPRTVHALTTPASTRPTGTSRPRDAQQRDKRTPSARVVEAGSRYEMVPGYLWDLRETCTDACSITKSPREHHTDPMQQTHRSPRLANAIPTPTPARRSAQDSRSCSLFPSVGCRISIECDTGSSLAALSLGEHAGNQRVLAKQESLKS